MGILVSALFTSFVHLQKKEALLQRAEKNLLQRHYFFSRLSEIFSSLVKGKNKRPDLEKKEDGVIFSFDHYIDPDPDFSGIIQGELFLKDQKVHLSIYPKQKIEEKRVETFFSDISELQIDILEEKNENPIDAPNPTAIQIELKGKESLSFLFPLKKNEDTIPIYPQ